MHLQEIHYLTFDLDLGVACNIAQHPPDHVTYTPAKFQVATSNGLGGDAFTKKINTLFDWEERAGCFTLNVFLLSSGCKFS